MKRLIILADIKEYLPQLDREEITTSRFAEILNEIANKRLGKYPHSNCDEGCYYYCTKNGQVEPNCINNEKE
jgi:hypothetical protein